MASTLLKLAVPGDQRDLFARRLVFYQLTELNGFADRLRWMEERPADATREDLAKVWARVESTLKALEWNRDEVLSWVWEWLKGEVAEADLFAPAVVLSKLDPGSERTRQWLSQLPAEIKRLLAQQVEFSG